MALLDQVTAYVAGASGSSWAPADVAAALGAEQVAQARACRIPDPMPADLVESLCRRVARNLALRPLPLGFQVNASEAAVATTRVGGLDAEIRRYEAPFRKVVVG